MFYVSDKTIIEVICTYYAAWKVSKYGVFSGPNTGKCEPEKTPYFDTFHAAKVNVPIQ